MPSSGYIIIRTIHIKNLRDFALLFISFLFFKFLSLEIPYSTGPLEYHTGQIIQYAYVYTRERDTCTTYNDGDSREFEIHHHDNNKRQTEKRVEKRNLIEEMKIIFALQTQNRQFNHRRTKISTTKNEKEGNKERQISYVSKFRTRRGPNDRLRV